MSATTVEWRQEHVHRYSPHSTDEAVVALITEWQAHGWQCRRLWGGGHDVLLVACRVKL